MSKQFLVMFLSVAVALTSVAPLWAQANKRPIYPKALRSRLIGNILVRMGRVAPSIALDRAGQTMSPS